MNSFIAVCLLAVVGVSHSNPVAYGGYGLGLGGYYGGYIAPAVSTANLYKAAPVPIIKTAAVAPIIAPAISTVPVLRTVGVSSLGLGYGGLGYGYGSYGYGGYGLGKGLGYGYGLGGWGGHGYGWGSKIYG